MVGRAHGWILGMRYLLTTTRWPLARAWTTNRLSSRACPRCGPAECRTCSPPSRSIRTQSSAQMPGDTRGRRRANHWQDGGCAEPGGLPACCTPTHASVRTARTSAMSPTSFGRSASKARRRPPSLTSPALTSLPASAAFPMSSTSEWRCVRDPRDLTTHRKHSAKID